MRRKVLLDSISGSISSYYPSVMSFLDYAAHAIDVSIATQSGQPTPPLPPLAVLQFACPPHGCINPNINPLTTSQLEPHLPPDTPAMPAIPSIAGTENVDPATTTRIYQGEM